LGKPFEQLHFLWSRLPDVFASRDRFKEIIMVIRVQHVPAQFASQVNEDGSVDTDTSNQTAPSTRTGGISYSLNQGGEVQSREVARHHVTHEGIAGGTVLSTLQTTFGKASVELSPGNPASRTGVEEAIREGHLERDASGQLREAAPKQQQQQVQQQHEQEQEQAASADAQHFDREDEQLWAQDIERLSQSGYEAIVALSIGAIANGSSLDDVATGLAQREGMEPALAREYVEQGIAKETRVVSRLLSSMGIPEDQHEAAFDHFRQRGLQLQDAMQRHVHTRDLNGWRQMAAEYKAVTTDTSAYEKAGFEVAIHPHTGELMLRRGEGQWRSAKQLAGTSK
jgi:hypothetical protein